MKVTFYTLGCKVNQYETEAMREAFAAAGHTPVPNSAPFDAAVINSCTVTAESDRKTRQLLHKVRRENPEAIIILTGCMVQAFSEEAKALTDADIVCGNIDVKKTVEYAERFLKDGERIFEVSEHKKTERFNTPVLSSFAERTRAYMKIEDGCDRYCTYCIIPTARGSVRSKPLAEIESEAETLSRAGFSEIVLVGINLTSYGKGEDMDICDAVEAAARPDGIKRVRLGSLEPDHMSDSVLKRLKAQKKFCPQFHLSLQSGCDETLKRMNRHYDTAFYRDLVSRIRAVFEDASVTTDVMVGFAGETEEEFSKSLAFVREIGFAKTHVFAYSRRRGTVAYGLPGQITRAEKAERSRRMIETALSCEEEFLKNLVGKTECVLFETAENGFAEGYTANYSRVRVKSNESLGGKILPVKITASEKEYCIGQIK